MTWSPPPWVQDGSFAATGRYPWLCAFGAGLASMTYIPSNGNLTGLKDAQNNYNNLTTFAYDSLNRVIDQTDPRGIRSTFTYNEIGLLTSTTNRMRLHPTCNGVT